jgi:hypothetical protein
VDGAAGVDQLAALLPLLPEVDAGAGEDDGVAVLSFDDDDDDEPLEDEPLDDEPLEEEPSEAVADLRLSVR